MKKQTSQKRRDFLRMTAAGAAGLTLTSKVDRIFASQGGWTDGMAINPDISNTRVVCGYDTGMFKNAPTAARFSAQNDAIDEERVFLVLDEMAKELVKAEKPNATADKAWETIFRSGRTWEETKVAIKVNCAYTGNMPRVAIIKKMCMILSGFGVQASNIVVYDSCGNASGSSKYTPYFSLTDTSKIGAVVSNRSESLGGREQATVSGASNVSCVADFINGVTDILINIAVNKGHGSSYGSCTLCMKNHLGTFTNTSSEGNASNLHPTNAFFNINKHAAVLGGDPPRQQLCIIDSLLASKGGPSASPNSTLYSRIVMGTLAPIVDYCCVKNIREPLLDASHNAQVVNRFLSDFGYSESDIEYVEFTPDPTAIGDKKLYKPAQTSLEIILSSSAYRPSSARILLPGTRGRIHIKIFDINGKVVRDLSMQSPSSKKTTITWDGRTNSGVLLSAGKYIVTVAAGRLQRTGTIIIDK